MSDKFLAVVRDLQQQVIYWRNQAHSRSRSANGYRLDFEDMSDLISAFRAIKHGDSKRGLKLFESVLGDLEPRWGEWL